MQEMLCLLMTMPRWCSNAEHLHSLLVTKYKREEGNRQVQMRVMRFAIQWLSKFPEDFSPAMLDTNKKVFGISKPIKAISLRSTWEPFAAALAHRAALCFIWFAPSLRLPRDVTRLIVGRIWDSDAWHTCDAFVEKHWWNVDHLDKRFPTFRSICMWPCAYTAREIAEALYAKGMEIFLSLDARRHLFPSSVSSNAMIPWFNRVAGIVPFR